MKQLPRFTSVLSLLILLACDHESPSPVPLMPDTFVQGDMTKVFLYTDDGRLAQIKMISQFPNGNTMESSQFLSYDTQGYLKELLTDTGWKLVYTQEGEGARILRADEYINGTKSSYHTFHYDNEGRLIEEITWQNIPEEGGEIPTSKNTFEYDTRGNLTTHRIYYYTPYGAAAKLLTVFTFSEYDDQMNTQDQFDAVYYNPLITFSKNNPGKLVVENGSGVMASTSTYQYIYNKRGYVTHKKVNEVLPNGDRVTYEAKYTFR